MKKRTRIVIAMLLCLTVAFATAACGGSDKPATAPADTGSPAAPAAPAATPKADAVVWNVGCINTDPAVSPELNAWGSMLLHFQQAVSEYTDGAIEIQIHWGGVLGGNPQLLEQCQMGELEVYSGQPMSGADPRFACWNIPYTWDSLEQIEKALDHGNGEIYKMSEEWVSDLGMHLLSMGASTMRGYANAKHEVIAPSDIKGLKSRVYEDELVRTFWDGLGQTQVLPVSDIYSALQTGAVDGLEMHATHIIVGKYYEVVKYYTDIDWQWTNSAMIIISDKAWTSITPEQQEAVRKAAWESSDIQTKEHIQNTKDAYGAMEAAGIQVTHLTPEQKQAWIDYAESQTETYKKIIGAETYDKYMAAVEAAKTAA